MVVETHMKLDVTARFSRKKCFAFENLENRPKMDQKHGFWNLLKDFAINFY